MGRQPCCDKVGIKRGPWTIEEDHTLVNFIRNNGIQCWRVIPKLAGLMRCGKSCRLRWINYLRPDLKRGAFTESEEDMIIQLHARLGNRWSKIAAHLPGRTDNEIKNHWNTKIKKKLKLLGLDPVTHKPVEQQDQKVDTENGQCIQQNNSSLEQDQVVMDPSNSQLNEDSTINLDHINDAKESINEIDSFMIKNSEPSDTFSLQTDIDYPQFEDPFQYWIGSPLSWDVFSNLGENLF